MYFSLTNIGDRFTFEVIIPNICIQSNKDAETFINTEDGSFFTLTLSQLQTYHHTPPNTPPPQKLMMTR